MEQETPQVTVDYTASLRLANLAVIVVVWLGWTAYSVLDPLVDLVPSSWGQYFIIAAVVALAIAALFYWFSGYLDLVIVIPIGFAALTFTVGFVVVNNLQSSLATTGLTAAQGAQIANVFSSSLGIYAVLPILLIVVVAMAVIFFLMNFATGRYAEAIG